MNVENPELTIEEANKLSADTSSQTAEEFIEQTCYS
jgi:hypothetical protein